MIGLSVPLVKRKIKRNQWYGVRSPEAFKSEERWLAINEYGGRLLLRWGIAVAVMAVIGLPLAKKYWQLVYLCGSLVVILGGLGMVTTRIDRYSAKTKKH
jgi:uncharacterized membrane protein